jgi:hypothetical protein
VVCADVAVAVVAVGKRRKLDDDGEEFFALDTFCSNDIYVWFYG